MKSKPFGSLSGNEKGGDSLQAAGRLACPHGLHATRSVPLWRAANVSTRTLTLTSTLTKPRAEYAAQNGGLASQTLPLCTSLLFEGTIITMLIIVPAADRGARVRAEELATGVGLFLFRLAVSGSGVATVRSAPGCGGYCSGPGERCAGEITRWKYRA